MRRRIKFLIMAEIAINLKQQLEELRVNRNQLLLDVNQIQN